MLATTSGKSERETENLFTPFLENAVLVKTDRPRPYYRRYARTTRISRNDGRPHAQIHVGQFVRLEKVCDSFSGKGGGCCIYWKGPLACVRERRVRFCYDIRLPLSPAYAQEPVGFDDGGPPCSTCRKYFRNSVRCDVLTTAEQQTSTKAANDERFRWYERSRLDGSLRPMKEIRNDKCVNPTPGVGFDQRNRRRLLGARIWS